MRITTEAARRAVIFCERVEGAEEVAGTGGRVMVWLAPGWYIDMADGHPGGDCTELTASNWHRALEAVVSDRVYKVED